MNYIHSVSFQKLTTPGILVGGAAALAGKVAGISLLTHIGAALCVISLLGKLYARYCAALGSQSSRPPASISLIPPSVPPTATFSAPPPESSSVPTPIPTKPPESSASAVISSHAPSLPAPTAAPKPRATATPAVSAPLSLTLATTSSASASKTTGILRLPEDSFFHACEWLDRTEILTWSRTSKAFKFLLNAPLIVWNRSYYLMFHNLRGTTYSNWMSKEITEESRTHRHTELLKLLPRLPNDWVNNVNRYRIGMDTFCCTLLVHALTEIQTPLRCRQVVEILTKKGADPRIPGKDSYISVFATTIAKERGDPRLLYLLTSLPTLVDTLDLEITNSDILAARFPKKQIKRLYLVG